MKKFKTYSDAGSVAIGTKEAWFLVQNGYGDGETLVLVFDTSDEFDEYCASRTGNWKFVTTIQGTRLEIIDYDCPSTTPWFDGSVHDWTPIETLNGRYAAYFNNGTVAFVRWGDAREL